MKDRIRLYWFMNRYEMKDIRRFTYKVGNNTTKYSYEEFFEMTGITVEEYDSNVELYSVMRYEDIKAYLAEKETEAEDTNGENSENVENSDNIDSAEDTKTESVNSNLNQAV